MKTTLVVFGVTLLLVFVLGITGYTCAVVLGIRSLSALPTVDTQRWTACGILLQGIGTLCAALAATIGGSIAYFSYSKQQESQRLDRKRQDDLDLTRLLNERVHVRRLLSTTPRDAADDAALQSEVEDALRSYEAMLEHVLDSRPSLKDKIRNATMARLKALHDVQAAPSPKA